MMSGSWLGTRQGSDVFIYGPVSAFATFVWFGLIAGLLIINDGSQVFGSGVVAIGLIAWKIAGTLKRL